MVCSCSTGTRYQRALGGVLCLVGLRVMRYLAIRGFLMHREARLGVRELGSASAGMGRFKRASGGSAKGLDAGACAPLPFLSAPTHLFAFLMPKQPGTKRVH
jgi:hypothetical protein